MTQKDKDLLLKDLSARLPYGVKVLYLNDPTHKWYNLERVDIRDNEVYLTTKPYGSYLNKYVGVEAVKPYLFPMSSMTEDQEKELNSYLRLDKEPIMRSVKEIDWYNKNHFDYRGLIPMGLANDATGLNIY